MNITIKELLEVGAHFGHKIENLNPKMNSYIIYERNGVHIINLEKTIIKINESCNIVNKIINDGGDVLFVCTKEKLKDVIKEEAVRCGMPYVDEFCTNEILNKPPALVFVVGTAMDSLILQEIRKLKIPIMSILDTNCDPDEVDYVIPANDDAVQVVKLITSVIADTIIK